MTIIATIALATAAALLGMAAGALIYHLLHRKTRAEARTLQAQNLELEKKVAALQAHKETTETARTQLQAVFENLGNRIFREHSEKLKKDNEREVGQMLRPLGETIAGFTQAFKTTDNKMAEKFGALNQQITGLADLNKSMGKQAENLANAIKGSPGTRGEWGELILEKTLEISGLKKGAEYSTQISYSTGDTRKRPDAIVHLPDKKDLVIDSKMSLLDYQACQSTDDPAAKARHMQAHIAAVRGHINGLAAKEYQNLEQIKTLNYVMMFIPMESAYIAVVEHDPGIFQYALDKNIVLVCPSTLLAVLRTVHGLWQVEKQNINAKHIADQAGKLYDKFVTFAEKLREVGHRLTQASQSHDEAQKLLHSGRGNLSSRAEKIKSLGARTTKSLPPDLSDPG